MILVWGYIITIFALIGWIGQLISAVSPKTAAKLGFCESEADADKTFFIDQTAEAIWDILTTWILAAAGIMLIVQNDSWVYFGLIGGVFYINLGGRGIITRIALIKNGNVWSN